MRENILQVLSVKSLLADGAMGSQIFERGVDAAKCYDLLNLEAPGIIEDIHRVYLAAGSQVIESNTFGANRLKLAKFNLSHLASEINLQGARLARRLAGEEVWVAGAVGPLGRLEELPSAQEIREAYAEQALALAEGGADIIILETFADLEILLLALEAVKTHLDLPVAAQMVFSPSGKSLDGREPSECFERLRRAGADVVGLNCGLGPKGAREVLAKAGQDDAPLSVFPNAGFPERLGDRLVYPSSPEYFARTLAACVPLGARLLGGCCGTGPAHIAALREALTQKTGKSKNIPLKPLSSGESCPVPPARGLFAHNLGRKKMFLVELDPPKHLDVSKTLEAAQALALAGVDAITVAENPLASPRLSNIALAMLIRERTGLETVIHLTGRDRNLIGMQSTLMGLASLGLNNLLAVTGDPPVSGGEERVSGVFDLRSFELIKLIDNFKQGRNAQGDDMRGPAGFCVGAAFNPNSRNIQMQLKRAERKAALGAEFFLTQPVYSLEKVAETAETVKHLGKPVFLGIMPLASSRNAEFLHNEFPGISIPEDVRRRMREAGEAGQAEGLEIAWELMRAARDSFAGFYLMPPFNRYKTALELFARLKALESSL